jgi:hypothetical protein
MTFSHVIYLELARLMVSWQWVKWELNGEREHGCGEGRERMDVELEGVQGMLGKAGIALIEVRAGLEQWDWK